MKLYEDAQSILFTKEQIAQRVKEIGEQISKDYAGEQILLVCILRGASVFFTDLIRQIDCDLSIDFMATSSYGAGASSSGEVKLQKDLNSPATGKHIIIVEDIVDTGLTLSYLKKMLLARNPLSVKICALLDKPSRRTAEIEADYVGFTIPNAFVIGYGLDYNERYRQLPDICILSPDKY